MISPTAAPINSRDILHGFKGIIAGERYIKTLEADIREYFGVKHVFLVSSGKAALTLILLALKSLSKKWEVLIPAYTCFSVPSAIVKAGLKVSLCDVNSSTFDFEYALLEKEINDNTVCVIPNHLFGIPSDMHRIRSICRSRGIYVVEDAAQAMGGLYEGRRLGTLGDVGFFSLGRGKNITCGSGGIIVTNSNEIAQAIEKYYVNLKHPNVLETLGELFQTMGMSICIHPVLYWLAAGIPSLKLGQTVFDKDFSIKKLSGTKAGLLRYWTDRLEETNGIRSETASYFSKRLQLKTRQTSTPFLRLPVILDSREKRDRVYSLSQRYGLGLSLMYPTTISEIDEIRVNFNGKVFPSAREIANRLVTIPTHKYVSEKAKDAICEVFKEVLIA